jgi:uncharacterized membrane protein
VSAAGGVSPLHATAVACHAVLVVAAGTLAYRAAGVTPWSELAAALATAPLLACVPGLLARRAGSAVWLAVLLVVYCGAACVEVVASSGSSRAASFALLAALAALGLLLMLVRRWRSPEARG